jgi:regulator of replication initiation timing
MADALLGTSRQQVQRLESAVASESKSSAENFGRVEASNSQLTELLGQIEKFREDNNLLIRKNTTMESELERLRTEVKSKEALLVTEKAKAQKSVDKVKEAMTMCHVCCLFLLRNIAIAFLNTDVFTR